MNGPPIPLRTDGDDAWRQAAEESLDELLSTPLGFAELAMWAAAAEQLRRRRERRGYERPGAN